MCQPLFFKSVNKMATQIFAVVFRLKETGQDNTFCLVENNMGQSGNVTLLPWMCVKIPAGAGAARSPSSCCDTRH